MARAPICYECETGQHSHCSTRTGQHVIRNVWCGCGCTPIPSWADDRG